MSGTENTRRNIGLAEDLGALIHRYDLSAEALFKEFILALDGYYADDDPNKAHIVDLMRTAQGSLNA